MNDSQAKSVIAPASRIVLALGSGSVLSLAASVALFHVLEKHSLAGQVKEVWGCSAGAIAGALWSGGMSAEEITQQIKQLKKSDLVDRNWRSALSLPLHRTWRGSLLYGRKLASLLKKWVGDRRFEDSVIPLRILVYRLLPAPEALEVRQSGSILSALNATFAMPGLFPPVSTEEGVYCDPTAAQKVPILSAAQAQDSHETKNTHIIATYCGWSGMIRERKPEELIGSLLHAKEMMQWYMTEAQTMLAFQVVPKISILTTPIYAVPNLAIERFLELSQLFAKDFSRQLGLSDVECV